MKKLYKELIKEDVNISSENIKELTSSINLFQFYNFFINFTDHNIDEIILNHFKKFKFRDI